jgi:hypothetical protein
MSIERAAESVDRDKQRIDALDRPIAIGAFLSRARSKKLRRAWAQHAASMIGPGLRDAA